MTPDGSILKQVQPHVRDMAPYTPVEPPEFLAQRLGLPVERIIKLDANENPYAPSARVLETLRSFRGYNVYPDPLQRRIRRALSQYLGIAEEWIVAGAGSDELIDLVTRMFVAPGEAILNFPPTFGMYAFSAEAAGARVIDLPRQADYSLKLEGLAPAAREASLIFAVSPNNPTGTPLLRDELDALLETGRPVVIDEAYAEFAGESYAALVRERPNLLILRTLSKWAGLAGLRVGYMIAAPEIIEVAMKIKQPYSVSVVAEAAALAAIEDRETLFASVAAIVAERERLAAKLRALEVVEVTPSRANFLLCRLDGLVARDVHRELLERGIMVRYFGTPLLQNCLRVSVGKPEHTDALIEALREIIAGSRPAAKAAS